MSDTSGNKIDFHVHVPYDKIKGHIAFLKQGGLNLEIYFNSHILDSITEGDILSLKKNLDYNPLLTIHAPFMDLSPGAIDSKVREATVARFNHVLDIAKELSVKAVVFHSGYEKWKYALKTDLWLEKSILTWKPLKKRAEEIGVKIAIENIFEDEPESLKLLMDKMGSDNFGICFDTGHLNLFSKASLEDWISLLKPYIIELHLHDNDKKSDAHAPIGDGTFDFDTLFSALKYKEIIYTLEAHNPEDARKSIERLQKYFL